MRERAPGGESACLRPRAWGGSRPGAGRPLKAGRRNVPHRSRELHQGHFPVHVTLRSTCRSLRCQFLFPTLRLAIADTNRAHLRASNVQHSSAPQFRICEFSVQGDHIHLIVEASSARALERGIRGLAIRIAKRVNRLTFRRERFFADRYHARDLQTARAVRNALVYVLANFRKHGRARPGQMLDVFSSAPYFSGYIEFAEAPPWKACIGCIPRILAPPATSPVANAGTQLLARDWMNEGRISVFDAPRTAPGTPR